MELTELLCKTCEARLDPGRAQNNVIFCEHCGNAYILPRKETSPKALSFLRMGEHELDVCKFDDALNAYEKAAEADKTEPEAYFGMALSEFKVQYLKDETADPPHLQPICHEISEKRFTENKNFQRAMSLASGAQKEAYEKKGDEIDRIRSEFLRLKESGLDYDCFLCVKVSSEDGGTTQDSHEALKLYHYLKERGYTPFYSEEEIKGRTGVDYEALILYALYTSECMLIVCSNEEYLQTKWVKNEYTRFAKMIVREGKEHDAITFVFRGKPIERLPGQDGKIQGIDLSKPDAYSRIEEFIGNHTGEMRELREKERKAQAERARAEAEERARREAENERKLNDLEAKQAAFVEQMENSAQGVHATVGTKLTRAWQEMDARDFTRARNFFESILEVDPQNAEAWWGLFLCDFSCGDEAAIVNKLSVDTIQAVETNRYYKSAVRYAGKAFQPRLDTFHAKMHDAEAWWGIFQKSVQGVKLSDPNPQKALQLLDGNEAYRRAWKYADDTTRPKLEAFRTALLNKAEQLLSKKQEECRALSATYDEAAANSTAAKEALDRHNAMREEWSSGEEKRKHNFMGGHLMTTTVVAALAVIITEIMLNIFVIKDLSWGVRIFEIGIVGGIIAFVIVGVVLFFLGYALITLPAERIANKAAYKRDLCALSENYGITIEEATDFVNNLEPKTTELLEAQKQTAAAAAKLKEKLSAKEDEIHHLKTEIENLRQVGTPTQS